MLNIFNSDMNIHTSSIAKHGFLIDSIHSTEYLFDFREKNLQQNKQSIPKSSAYSLIISKINTHATKSYLACINLLIKSPLSLHGSLDLRNCSI